MKVLIVDAEPLARRGLRHFLEAEAGCKVVAEAGGLAEARAARERWQPELVVLDVAVEAGDALHFITECTKLRPVPAVVVLTEREDPESVRRAIIAGAWGYVSKRDAEPELRRTLEKALAGRRHLGPRIEELFLEGVARGPEDSGAVRTKLSGREYEVFLRCAEGKTARQMAQDLGVSAKTVETHLRRIAKKLRVQGLRAVQRLALLTASGEPGQSGRPC